MRGRAGSGAHRRGLFPGRFLQLIIVRHFNDEDGEEELFEATITEDGELLEKLPGQHQLLGWALTTEQLGFLASIQAGIWADEYGQARESHRYPQKRIRPVS